MNTHAAKACFILGVCLSIAACSEPDNGFGTIDNIDVLITPDTHVFQSIRLNEPSSVAFQVENISEDDGLLKVFDTVLDTGSASTDFELECAKGSAFELRAGETMPCTLRFTPTMTTAQSGVIFFYYSQGSSERSTSFTFTTENLQPRLEATPSRLEFNTPEGESSQDIVELRNTGEAPLRISDIALASQTEVFSVEILPELGRPLPSEASPWILQPYNDAVGPEDPNYLEQVLPLAVTYTPNALGTDESSVIVRSDDPGNGALPIPLRGSSLAPCLLVAEGTQYDFLDTSIGGLNQKTITLQNCGSAPLEITQFEPTNTETGMLSDTSNSSAVFLIDTGTNTADSMGFFEQPIIIEPGQTDAFVVSYAPTDEGLSRGGIRVHNNTTVPQLQIDLFGNGVINACPMTIATATLEGALLPPSTELQAKPLDTLLLDGSLSLDSDGEVVEWSWTIVQSPLDSTARIEVLEGGQAQMFLDLAGHFVIEARAIDDKGTPSCEPVLLQVFVVPCEAIHIQLVWNNPADDDQSDNVGSDIDLHFVKMGPGRWNEAPYDTYWRNAEPFWTPENPSLDIDDTNGAGPENINLDNPTQCTWYAVGVHYFRQVFATAYVTLRIFINGLVVFEAINTPLQQSGEWWDIARIHWPSQSVIAVNEVGAQLPRGQQPTVTQEMIDSELCGVAELLGGE